MPWNAADASKVGADALEDLLLWLLSYRNLFTQPCTIDGQLLANEPSSQNPVPPLFRPFRCDIGGWVGEWEGCRYRGGAGVVVGVGVCVDGRVSERLRLSRGARNVWVSSAVSNFYIFPFPIKVDLAASGLMVFPVARTCLMLKLRLVSKNLIALVHDSCANQRDSCVVLA